MRLFQSSCRNINRKEYQQIFKKVHDGEEFSLPGACYNGTAINGMLVVIEINRSIPEESFELDHHMLKNIYIIKWALEPMVKKSVIWKQYSE